MGEFFLLSNQHFEVFSDGEAVEATLAMRSLGFVLCWESQCPHVSDRPCFATIGHAQHRCAL